MIITPRKYKPTIGYMISDVNYNEAWVAKFRRGYIPEFEFNFDTPEDEQIVVFSDINFKEALTPRFKNVPYKIAYMIESPALFAECQPFIEARKFLLDHLDDFYMCTSCDESLIKKYPDKFKYIPIGQSYIPRDETFIYNKTKLCSLTSGVMRWKSHKFRIDIFNEFKNTDLIDFLGGGFNSPYKTNVEAFSPYMYHINVPNTKQPTYLSAHELDALACGTIPIHCGCDLSRFFDMNGIITFNTIDELKNIMGKIGPDDYYDRMDAIKYNLKQVEIWREPESRLWNLILKDIYK